MCITKCVFFEMLSFSVKMHRKMWKKVVKYFSHPFPHTPKRSLYLKPVLNIFECLTLIVDNYLFLFFLRLQVLKIPPIAQAGSTSPTLANLRQALAGAINNSINQQQGTSPQVIANSTL